MSKDKQLTKEQFEKDFAEFRELMQDIFPFEALGVEGDRVGAIFDELEERCRRNLVEERTATKNDKAKELAEKIVTEHLSKEHKEFLKDNFVRDLHVTGEYNKSGEKLLITATLTAYTGFEFKSRRVVSGEISDLEEGMMIAKLMTDVIEQARITEKFHQESVRNTVENVFCFLEKQGIEGLDAVRDRLKK